MYKLLICYNYHIDIHISVFIVMLAIFVSVLCLSFTHSSLCLWLTVAGMYLNFCHRSQMFTYFCVRTTVTNVRTTEKTLVPYLSQWLMSMLVSTSQTISTVLISCDAVMANVLGRGVNPQGRRLDLRGQIYGLRFGVSQMNIQSSVIKSLKAS